MADPVFVTPRRLHRPRVKIIRREIKTIFVPFGGQAAPVKPDKTLHGGKGASLLQMTALGLRVPPGFILTIAAYRRFKDRPQQFFPDIDEDIQNGLRHIEGIVGRTFEDANDPLLLSVRSGAPVSMPGMMDTILNLGLNTANVERVAKLYGDLFAWGSLLRLIAQFAKLVLLPRHQRRHVVRQAHHDVTVRLEGLLDMGQPPKDTGEAQHRCREALTILKNGGTPFPEDPQQQLQQAIETVFHSWDNERAQTYRKLQGIGESLGTACTVQAMVFGNRSEESGTGVCFSRDPSTGEKGLVGEFLRNAQGEDVVAGFKTPDPIHTLPARLLMELKEHVATLEREFRDVVDVEFTVEDGTLYFLQCRTAKRSAEAALTIADALHREGVIMEEEMLQRISPDHVVALLRPRFDEQALAARRSGNVLTRGLPAGPGAASGRIAFDAPSRRPLFHTEEHRAERDASRMCDQGPPQGDRGREKDPFILVRRETSPEDVGAMSRAAGVLTIHGGMSSHAALVARQLGIVTVVGCEEAQIDDAHRLVWFGNKPLKEGDWISLNGTTGEIYEGKIATVATDLETTPLPQLLKKADAVRRLGIHANADTIDQAMLARRFGAEGIGLARTEHMFFASRLPLIQHLILAVTAHERLDALGRLEALQQEDFRGLLLAMDGLPVTVRTIDPPLHEFLPKEKEDVGPLAMRLALDVSELQKRIDGMREANPMLGLRGCRLGILHPEIPLMQIRALLHAACDLRAAGKNPQPAIMIPLASSPAELREHREAIATEAQRVMEERGITFSLPIGTMIEVPRAALLAGELAQVADFFSFGTNDLTQLTYGISRDDASTFLPAYVERGIYPADPFASLDREGVGQLMERAVNEARAVKPDLPIGICGEHGGDPASIHFCEELSLSYVSCSPYRVPVARLAAAQAALA